MYIHVHSWLHHLLGAMIPVTGGAAWLPRRHQGDAWDLFCFGQAEFVCFHTTWPFVCKASRLQDSRIISRDPAQFRIFWTDLSSVPEIPRDSSPRMPPSFAGASQEHPCLHRRSRIQGDQSCDLANGGGCQNSMDLPSCWVSLSQFFMKNRFFGLMRLMRGGGKLNDQLVIFHPLWWLTIHEPFILNVVSGSLRGGWSLRGTIAQ